MTIVQQALPFPIAGDFSDTLILLKVETLYHLVYLFTREMTRRRKFAAIMAGRI